MYKHECEASPQKILFLNIISHILNKILGTFQNSDGSDTLKSKYFIILKEILISLSDISDKDNKITHLIKFNVREIIVKSIKQLIYRDLDSRSLRNPIIL